MKQKIYRFFRRKFNLITHKTKVKYYSFVWFYSDKKQTNSFSFSIAKKLTKQIFLNLIIILSLLYIDSFLVLFFEKFKIGIDLSLLPNIILSGIGIAGIFLALYCANLTSIYSTKYSNAPASIASIFEDDILTNKSINNISDYIIFSLLLILAIVFKQYIGVVSILYFFIFSIWIVISFGLIGNRRHRLADTYGIADKLYLDIFRVMNYATCNGIFFKDTTFQNHYQKTCDIKLKALKDIAEFNLQDASNKRAAMVKFMNQNNYLLSMYWEKKNLIPHNSLWFKGKYEYVKWHFASDTEIDIALRTGTTLQAKESRDIFWFEDAIIDINNILFDSLLKSKDWKGLYSFCTSLSEITFDAINCNSIKNYLNNIKNYNLKILELCVSELSVDATSSQKDHISILIEIMMLNYISIILNMMKYLETIDWEDLASYSIGLKNYNELDYKRNPYLNNQRSAILYQGISTEYIIEKKRITGDWYVEQTLSHNIFEILEEHVKIINNIYNTLTLNIGKCLFEKQAYLEAMLVFSRMAELRFKIEGLLHPLKDFISFLKNKHLESTVIWTESSLPKFFDEMNATYATIPLYWSKCALNFYDRNWEKYEQHPDMLGGCYNYLCNYLIDALADFNFNAFKDNYIKLLDITLLYQQYILKDVIDIKESHLQNMTTNIFIKPLLEYSEISGYAYLWGELVDPKWKELVEKTLEDDIRKRGVQSSDFYSCWIASCNFDNQKPPGIYNRDVIETGWKIILEQVIKKNGLLKYKYRTDIGILGIEELDTDNKLIKAFFNNSSDYTPSHYHAHEVFLIMCINKYVPQNKQFKSRWKWEDRLHDDK